MTDPLKYSRRNDLYIRSDFQPANDAVDEFYAEYVEFRKISGTKAHAKSDTDLVKHNLKIILLDLFATWLTDPSLYIGYSRNHAEFRKGGSYFNPIIPVCVIVSDILSVCKC